MIYNPDMNKKGFTLMELLIAVAIIGILSAIAVPIYRGYQKSAMRQEATSNLQAIRMCVEEYFAENNRYGKDDGGGSYNWSGNGTTDNFSDWLPCFNPRSASGGVENKFDYNLTVNADNITYLATATGRTGFQVAEDTFTIDQAGVKGGDDGSGNNPWPQ
jgi:type IV pilus assembly protein PilE